MRVTAADHEQATNHPNNPKSWEREVMWGGMSSYLAVSVPARLFLQNWHVFIPVHSSKDKTTLWRTRGGLLSLGKKKKKKKHKKWQNVTNMNEVSVKEAFILHRCEACEANRRVSLRSSCASSITSAKGCVRLENSSHLMLSCLKLFFFFFLPFPLKQTNTL